MKMKVEDGISKWAEKVLNRSSTAGIRAWLNRVAYPKLLQVQLKRWQTEGSSEGETWAALNPDYARSKLKRFAGFPGGGRKMLIATGRLVQSMTGQSGEGRKIVTENKLELVTTVPYAVYVDEKRDITGLSEETVDELVDELISYLMGA